MFTRPKNLIEGHIKKTDEVSITEFATEINKCLSEAIDSWLTITGLLAKAKKQLNKDKFNELKTLIPLSDSSIYKLIKIADSDWINKNKPKLKKIDSWATLHEITKLKHLELQEFEKQYCFGDDPKYFTRDDVSGFRKIENKRPILIASIKKNRNAELSSKDLKELEDLFKSVGEINGLQLSFNKNLAEYTDSFGSNKPVRVGYRI